MSNSIAWYQILRSSFLSLRREPRFAISIILALGIGIGANAALFSVVNGLLFKPLPYRAPNEIVEIQQSSRQHHRIPLNTLSQATTLVKNGVAVYNPANFQIRGTPEGPAVTRRYGLRITPNLFTVLGVDPLIGPGLNGAEPAAVLLSFEYWRTAWNGDPSAVGKTITIGDAPFVIAGVLSPDFVLNTRDANVFVSSDSRSFTDGRTIARRRPDATLAQVRAEIEGLGTDRRSTQVVPVEEAFRPGDAVGVVFLQGAVGLVLLITCANVGNLMLARSIRRGRELAVRSALGASTRNLAQMLLTESAVLAAAGGILGLGFASAFHGVLESWLPTNLHRALRGPAATSVVDPRVLGFTIAISIVAVLAFGLAPALTAASRVDVISSLKAASSRSTTPRNQRFGQFLAGAEVALAVLLLVGAGLLLKSLVRLNGAYLGFTDHNVLRAVVDLTPQRHPSPEHRANAMRKLLDDLTSIPGVESAGVFGPQFFPFGGPRVRGAEFLVQDHALPAGEPPRAEVYTATPGYFKAVRIPLLRGRMFDDRTDTQASEPVALLSDVVARRTFGSNVDPIGKRVRFDLRDPSSPWITVIGIVGDVRNPVGADVQPTAYRPWAQNARTGDLFFIRTRDGSPAMSYAQAVRQVLHDADPGAPEPRVADLEDSVSQYITPQRFSARLIGGFAIFGLLLAGAGVYGVMRYWVQARIPEIGIRVALGAQRSSVTALVMRRAVSAAGLGGLAGLAAALALHRVMDSQLHGVSSTDPAIFLSVAAILVLTAIVAAYVPARAAARVDPLVALREE
jgi:putative ABC transport system permease protein